MAQYWTAVQGLGPAADKDIDNGVPRWNDNLQAASQFYMLLPCHSFLFLDLS